MAGNSIGQIFRLTTFGESHGLAIGGVVDGVPANFEINITEIQKDLDRRKPGQSSIVTQRRESDIVQILSGIFEGKTTGAPIGFMIQNENQKSKDYSHIKDKYRPSHADFTYDKKYGHRDYRGGGRSSARETASRVVAGAIAKQFLKSQGIEVNAFVEQVGKIKMLTFENIDYAATELNDVRCPDPKVAEEMITFLKEVKKQGDTVGGVIQCHVLGTPVGLGEPVFDKLHADLGKAILSINAVKGFEFGSGFSGSEMFGSQHNDLIQKDSSTTTNNSGGVQGGISNGEMINMRVAFKPVATLMRDQKSINDKSEEVTIQGKGRHDPCVVPRAVVIVEAMASIILFDYLLRNKTTQL